MPRQFTILSQNIIKCCKYCGKLCNVSNIGRHEKSCMENPNWDHKCKQCNKNIKINQIFCSNSCSAIFNNDKRGNTLLLKIKNSVIKYIEDNRVNFIEKCKDSSKLTPRHKTYRKRECKVCHIIFDVPKCSNGGFSNRITCSDICYKIASVGIRTYQNKGMKHFKIFNKYQNKIIILESSWEYEIAQFFDNNNIIWIRPKPISWIDKFGKNRLYFPDFYLDNMSLYVDPKNPYCMEKDLDKMMYIEKVVNIIYGDVNFIKNWIIYTNWY